MQKILMVAAANNFWTIEYIRGVIDFENASVDIADIGSADSSLTEAQKEYYAEKNINVLDFRIKVTGKLRKLNLLRQRIRNICKMRAVKKYDVVILHYVTEESLGALLFKPRNTKVIPYYHGSDLLRANRVKRKINKRVLKKCPCAVVTVKQMREYISSNYGEEAANKTKVLHFGVSNLDYLDAVTNGFTKEQCRERFGMPKDKTVIFVGYNGNPAHKHLQIIEELNKLPQEVKDGLYLACHCSYALQDSYRAELEKAIEASSIECGLFFDFLEGSDMMQFRNCGDIFLNLQPTDALSASMLENMALGNIAVKGDWLAYDELDDLDAYILSVPSIEALPDLIREILPKMEDYKTKCASNGRIIYDFLSWNGIREKWRDIISD